MKESSGELPCRTDASIKPEANLCSVRLWGALRVQNCWIAYDVDDTSGKYRNGRHPNGILDPESDLAEPSEK